MIDFIYIIGVFFYVSSYNGPYHINVTSPIQAQTWLSHEPHFSSFRVQACPCTSRRTPKIAVLESRCTYSAYGERLHWTYHVDTGKISDVQFTPIKKLFNSIIVANESFAHYQFGSVLCCWFRMCTLAETAGTCATAETERRSRHEKSVEITACKMTHI